MRLLWPVIHSVVQLPCVLLAHCITSLELIVASSWCAQIQVLRNNSTFNPSFKSGIALDPWADPIPPAASPTSSSTSSETPTALSALPSDSSETLTQTQDTSSSPSPTPAPKSSSQEKTRIDVPFLTINSEAFTLWKPHFYLIRNIVKSVHSTSTWFFTIR